MLPGVGDVARAGEISLRELVLTMGGMKERCPAALRTGVTTVIVRAPNARDVPDLPPEARNKLELVQVKTVDEVLGVALEENSVVGR